MKLKKSMFSCGEYVYSYQNENIKCPIIKSELRYHDQEKTAYNYAYKLELPDGSESKWMSALSISKNKKK